MKSRLFGPWQRQKSESPRRAAPPETRLYAIGDIHGSLEPLRALRAMIRSHASDYPIARKSIVYLGDYIDRGLESRGVIDLLLHEKLPGFDDVFLKGNHEEAILNFLADGTALPWLAYGGVATLLSYGVHPPDPITDERELQRARRELALKMPAEHRNFLQNLVRYHIAGDYLFVHAGLRPGVPLEEQTDDDLLWIREEFLKSREDFGKLVVHGHTITREPDVQPNRIGIDTGAFASGRLTCLVLEGTSQSLLST
jgi:serine/threonine protein phosphatase 1